MVALKYASANATGAWAAADPRYLVRGGSSHGPHDKRPDGAAHEPKPPSRGLHDLTGF